MKYEYVDTYNFPRRLLPNAVYASALQDWLLGSEPTLTITCPSLADARSCFYACKKSISNRGAAEIVKIKRRETTVYLSKSRTDTIEFAILRQGQ